MYIERINQNKAFPNSSINFKLDISNPTYFLLSQGLLKIAYKYNKETDTFTYYAYSKLGASQLIFFYLSVDSSGSVKYESRNESSAYGLYRFLLNKEAGKDKEALSLIYQGIDESIIKFASLTVEENKRRLELRNSFLDNVSSLPDKKEVEIIRFDVSSIILCLGIKENYYGGLSDNAAIGFELSSSNKDKMLLNAYEFLDSFSYGIRKGKKKYDIKYDLVSKIVNPYIVLASYSMEDDARMGIDKIVDLLPSVKGSQIKINNEKFYLSEEVKEAGINLNEDGSISLNPDLRSGNEVRLFGSFSSIVSLNKGTSLLTIYTFSSEKAKKIYDYISLYKLSNDEIGYIQDLVVSKMKKEKGLKIVGSNNKYVIKYYVDYWKEVNKLTFKTELYFDNELVELDAFGSNEFAKEYYSAFEEEVSLLHGLINGEQTNESLIYAFLKSPYKDLSSFCELYLSANLNDLKKSGFNGIKVKLTIADGWVSGKVEDNEYNEEQINEIILAYKKKKQFVLVKNELININDEKVKNLVKVSELLNDETGKERNDLPFWTTFSLSNKEGISLDLSSSLNNFVSELSNYKKAKLDLPKELISTLRPYQKNGVKWLSTLNKYKLPALLADDMGLGKTLQTICFIKTLKEKGPILIVCPKSVTYNWQKEVKKWAPELKTNVVSGSIENRNKELEKIKEGREEIFITSYESLRNDLDKYSSCSFLLVILDEAQNIKNPKAKKSLAVKSIASKYRLALTGTPIENSAIDLFSIFDFLMEGYLGNDKEFASRYSSLDKESINELYNKIKPFYLRRRKEDVLSDLPPKTVEVVSVTMDEEESKFYKANLEKARLEENSGNAISILATITKLRTICVDTSSFFNGANFISSKLQFTLDKVRQGIETGHKFIIFSSFAKVLHHLNQLLNDEKIENRIIEGDTSAKDRVSISENFNTKDDIKVVLVSLKAGGTGLNLYGADIVIHLDPWWNVAEEEQATDRAHRIGQTRPVTVLKLVAFNTIEEKVLKLQEMKADIASSLIKEGDNAITKLSKDDIKFLLS